MKKRVLILAAVFALALPLWGTAVQASQFTLTSSHNLSAEVSLLGGPPVAASVGFVHTYVNSTLGLLGIDPYEYNTAYDTQFMPPFPQTALASLPSGAWAKVTEAAATGNQTTATISTNSVGYGPSKNIGPLAQLTRSIWYLRFTAPANGLYEIVVTDAYTAHLSLEQSAGSQYPLNGIDSTIEAIYWVNYPVRFGGSRIRETYLRYKNILPTPLPDVSKDGSGTITLNIMERYPDSPPILLAGDTIEIYWQVSTSIWGQSPIVPVPSSLLLLGTCLVGLWALRRRK